MRKLLHKKVVEYYKLVPFGSKGWLYNPYFNCTNPSCGKHGKFGFKISEKGGGVHCFKCDHTESIFSFLKGQGKMEFVLFNKETSIKEKLSPIDVDEEHVGVELEPMEMPIGFKRLDHDEYLDGRGFEPWQYKQFEVGFTDSFLEKKLNNYIIFTIRLKGEIVAWLARSKRSKKWHKKNDKQAKKGKCPMVLRYRNSADTEFSNILGGFDEISKKTKRLILVEGLMDKANTDKLMKLNETKKTKCCFTFGNKISDEQIRLIGETNVEEIILMYDCNTIKQIKTYSAKLSQRYKVWIAEITDEEIDPGNMTKEYLDGLLSNLKDFLYFYTSRIEYNLKEK